MPLFIGITELWVKMELTCKVFISHFCSIITIFSRSVFSNVVQSISNAPEHTPLAIFLDRIDYNAVRQHDEVAFSTRDLRMNPVELAAPSSIEELSLVTRFDRLKLALVLATYRCLHALVQLRDSQVSVWVVQRVLCEFERFVLCVFNVIWDTKPTLYIC